VTLRGARLTLPADVDGDGQAEQGVFDLSTGVSITPGIRTGDLIGQTGSQAAALIDYVSPGDQGRAGYNLDVGGGAAFYRVEFRGFEGSSGRWGNGSSDDVADAEAEDVWRQLSVWQRYLNRGEFDSRSPATFEWGDYSSSGAYDPIAVSVEEPAATFSAEEQTSVFSGDVTLISVRAIEQARQSTAQDSR